jgi:hypothetical protein
VSIVLCIKLPILFSFDLSSHPPNHPPTHPHRAGEWVLWNYPFGHHHPARPVAPAAPAPAAVPVAPEPLPEPCVQPDTQAEESAAEVQLHVPVNTVSLVPSTPQPVQVAVHTKLAVEKQTGKRNTKYTCTATGFIEDPIAAAAQVPASSKLSKRKHQCTHHTSCVVGKCSECPCDLCKANQVSGKRAVKQRKAD